MTDAVHQIRTLSEPYELRVISEKLTRLGLEAGVIVPVPTPVFFQRRRGELEECARLAVANAVRYARTRGVPWHNPCSFGFALRGPSSRDSGPNTRGCTSLGPSSIARSRLCSAQAICTDWAREPRLASRSPTPRKNSASTSKSHVEAMQK